MYRDFDFHNSKIGKHKRVYSDISLPLRVTAT